MNAQDHRQPSILSRHGFQITGHADLRSLIYSNLPDDVLVESMRRMALGLDPGVDLAAHAITEAAWCSRRCIRRLACEVDPKRRRLRKLKKRRHRHR